MKRSMSSATFALAAIALALIPGPATAKDWTAATVSDLIAAINAANAAGGSNTITLVAGNTFTLTKVNNTTNGANGLPVIAANNNLTIEGNGATIARSAAAGTPAFRLFDVAAGASLTLTNLTLANGLEIGALRTAASGGCILNEAGGSLTVDHTTFVGNQVVGGDGNHQAGGMGRGGAVENEGTATFDHDTFGGNQAIGGATTHGKNQGGQGWGGAIGNGPLGTLTVSNCWFTGNRAIGGLRHSPSAQFDGLGRGGAVDNENTATITDSTFTDNEVLGGAPDPGVDGGYAGGGAVGSGGPEVANSVITIRGSVLTRNLAIGADAGPANIGGTGWSGAISSGYSQVSSTVNISDCSFTANQAIGGKGGCGGLGQGGAVSQESSPPPIRSCTRPRNRCAEPSPRPRATNRRAGLPATARSGPLTYQSVAVDSALWEELKFVSPQPVHRGFSLCTFHPLFFVPSASRRRFS